MERLLLSAAVVALLSAAAVIGASAAEMESDVLPAGRPATPQFHLFSMFRDHQRSGAIKAELDPRLSFKRKITSATGEAYAILRKCFKDAVLMEAYVKQRRDAPGDEFSRVESNESEGGAAEQEEGFEMQDLSHRRDDTLWGLFDFQFLPGGEDLSYIEDIAWAVKSVVDVYDNTPMCKKAIKEREGRFMRFGRKVVGQSLKDIVSAFLSISLHKAMFDWAVRHNKVSIFTGEEIPTLVATAREGIQKQRKLKKLDGQLKSEKYRNWMVSKLKAVVANQYLGNVSRASELVKWELWRTRRGRRDGLRRGQAMIVDETSGVPPSPREGTSEKEDEVDAARLKEVKTFLVSARLFLIMVNSKFVHIGKMISDTAEAIGNEVIGNDVEGHRIVESLPCPSNDKNELIDPDGKTLSKFRANPTVWVYRFHGLPKAERGASQPLMNEDEDSSSSLEMNEEPVSAINNEALTELVNVLADRDQQTLRMMFRDTVPVGEIRHEHIAEAVKPLFPTQCFKNKKDAVNYWRRHGPFPISKDEVPLHFTEMKLSGMRNYQKIMAKHLREDEEKIKKDIVFKVSKKLAIKQFFKGALGGIAVLAAVGVAVIGLACLIGVGVAATPLVSLPGCALAAALFGPATLAVVPTLSLAALALGGFFFAYATIASIKSALKFVITPIIMNKRENYYVEKQMQLREQQRHVLERRLQRQDSGEEEAHRREQEQIRLAEQWRTEQEAIEEERRRGIERERRRMEEEEERRRQQEEALLQQDEEPHGQPTDGENANLFTTATDGVGAGGQDD